MENDVAPTGRRFWWVLPALLLLVAGGFFAVRTLRAEEIPPAVAHEGAPAFPPEPIECGPGDLGQRTIIDYGEATGEGPQSAREALAWFLTHGKAIRAPVDEFVPGPGRHTRGERHRLTRDGRLMAYVDLEQREGSWLVRSWTACNALVVPDSELDIR